MKQQNNNYWSGFGLGILGGAGLMYLVGTRKGRELLRQFLNNTDEIEHSVEDIMGYVSTFLPRSEGQETTTQSTQDQGKEPTGLFGVMSKIKGIKLPKKTK